MMTVIEDAYERIYNILNEPEVLSHEDYVLLLIRMGNYIGQQRQLLQDAADGHGDSKRMCEVLELNATVRKYTSSLQGWPRAWPAVSAVRAG